MIRVDKSTKIPSSLITKKAYDGEDVKIQLLADQSKKCYLCERTLVTDFEIEHRNSKGGKQDWNNLFLACGYCNKKKLHHYDDIIDPATNNVEEIIKHEIVGNQAVFTTFGDVNSTIMLLNSIHNGITKLRKIKEEQFFEYVKGQVNTFSALVLKYSLDRTERNRDAVVEELDINKEFLGFKYWIISSNEDLRAEFADDIIWNK